MARCFGRLFWNLEKGDGSMALWGGRFEAGVAEVTQEFGASLPVDKHLYKQDIAGSKAHAKMLAAQGIISAEDEQAIAKGLTGIEQDIDAGNFTFDINAKKDDKVILPGYTHLQHAQPVLLSHHLLAYSWMFARDFTRLKAAFDAADNCPLGAAALAGTSYPLDRQMTAAELGFAGVIPNSLDAVSDRDFLLDLHYAGSVMAMHLSRLSEEIVLWSSSEFGFITLSDSYSTGSSIMPQKKNPDFAELIRGKSGRVYGNLVQLLVTMKGLPLAYNKDLQEDKEGALDTAHTLMQCLSVMAGMISTWTVNEDAMARECGVGHLAATDVADYLAKRGLPFREAHAVVGHLVLMCEKRGCNLEDLPFEVFQEASPLFEHDITEALDIPSIVAARTTEGGTAPAAVAVQLERAEAQLVVDEGVFGSLTKVVEMGHGAK